MPRIAGDQGKVAMPAGERPRMPAGEGPRMLAGEGQRMLAGEGPRRHPTPAGRGPRIQDGRHGQPTQCVPQCGNIQGMFWNLWSAVVGCNEQRLQPSQISQMRLEHKVVLFLSDMPGVPNIPGAWKAVHSSILVDNIEYSFSSDGITRCEGPQSHNHFPGQPELIDMGTTDKSGQSMMQFLSDDFKPGTYDLLRKNCNSFSDCALFYLVGKRMDKENRTVEKLFVAPAVAGVAIGYTPNLSAEMFKTRNVTDRIAQQRARELCTAGV